MNRVESVYGTEYGREPAFMAQLPMMYSHLPSAQSVTSGGFEMMYFLRFVPKIFKV